jgi:hypothetical protein
MRLATWGLLVSALLWAATANAQVVYTNGPISGGSDAYTITGLFAVTDSFTAAFGSTLTTATVGIWEHAGATSIQLRWSVGTSPFGVQVASGTSALSSSLAKTTNVGGNLWDIYSSTFSLSGFVNTGTTYWLTLQNETNTANTDAGWDDNGGPSLAEYAYNGTPLAGNPSESFTLYGTPVPEPGTFAFVGIAAALTVGRRRRCFAIA